MTTSTLTLAPDAPNSDANSTEAAKAHKKLETRAVAATFWTVMDYGCSMGLRVVNSMILTRLLMPESFGLMTLVTTLVTGISLLSDIGLNSSVIQSPRGDDPAFLNTAWTVQILRGVGIFAVAMILMWPMSLLYREPRLLLLLPVIGLNVVISSFNSTNLLSMSRHLGVRRVFLLDIGTQVVSLIVTAISALIYRSVWALVIGAVLSTLFRLILSHHRGVIPGIRNRLCWEKESLHGLVHFGKWILLATALFFFASQADRLIMGRLVSLSLLGVYGIAYSVSDIPRAVINAFANRVGFPFIAKMSHLPISEFRKMFLQYRLRTLSAGAFLLCLMVHLGGPLVTRMYDARYHAASWMVPVLALGLWHTLMYATTMPALLALGKSHYGAIGNACYFAAIITAIPLGFYFFGMFGAVVAVALGDLPLYFVLVTGASREGVSTWRQDALVTTIFAAMLGIGYGVRVLLVR